MTSDMDAIRARLEAAPRRQTIGETIGGLPGTIRVVAEADIRTVLSALETTEANRRQLESDRHSLERDVARLTAEVATLKGQKIMLEGLDADANRHIESMRKRAEQAEAALAAANERAEKLAKIEIPCTCPTTDGIHDPIRYVNCARARVADALRPAATPEAK